MPPAYDPPRLPPVPEIVTELQATCGFRAGWRADGILQWVFIDFKRDTMRNWEEWTLGYLDNVKGREAHLYDLTRAPALPVYAFKSALMLNSHKNARLVRLGILTQDTAVGKLIQTITGISVGAESRTFTKKEDTIAWLLRYIAP